ncbi:hypothetical protein M0804_013854 [Polistes exclamans]|nr:hypothetical protein M0804_013854 [Polistes exclamans]
MDGFPIWLNNFEYLVDFLGILCDKKAYTLLIMIKSFTLFLIKTKIAPAGIQYLSYDKIVCTLMDTFSHYDEKFAARYRFDTRFQFYYESARHCADNLKKLIAKCDLNYDITSLLLDRFIIGLKSDLAKNKLLQIRNLTLDIAINLVESIEIYENKYYDAIRIADEYYEKLKQIL